MQILLTVCGCITATSAAIAVLTRGLLAVLAVRKGQQCLLRQQMLDTYYKCKETAKIRQYRYEAFMLSYEAYKALGGNSFIDHIKEEVEEFEVIS